MEKKYNLEIMLKKFEQLNNRYENIIKYRQWFIFITLFTSAFYLYLLQNYLHDSYIFSFIIILLFPAIMVLALWIQNFIFFLPHGFTKSSEYAIHEREWFNLKELTSDIKIYDIFDKEFDNLYRSIIINSKRIKTYQMVLTITWMFLIIATIFPIIIRSI